MLREGRRPEPMREARSGGGMPRAGGPRRDFYDAGGMAWPEQEVEDAGGRARPGR